MGSHFDSDGFKRILDGFLLGGLFAPFHIDSGGLAHQPVQTTPPGVAQKLASELLGTLVSPSVAQPPDGFFPPKDEPHSTYLDFLKKIWSFLVQLEQSILGDSDNPPPPVPPDNRGSDQPNPMWWENLVDTGRDYLSEEHFLTPDYLNKLIVLIETVDTFPLAPNTFQQLIPSLVSLLLRPNTFLLAENEVVTTKEDTPFTGTFNYLISNEPGPVNFLVVQGPIHGSMTVQGNQFIYTPDYLYFGPDSFKFELQDSFSTSNVAEVDITIQPVPPTASPGTVDLVQKTRFEERNGEGPLLTVYGQVSASDAINLPLVYSLVSGTSHGKLLFNPDGSFSYNPRTEFHGTDSFVFQVTDPAGLTATATETLVVERNHKAFILGDHRADVSEFNLLAQGTLIALDFDPGQSSFFPESIKAHYGTFTLDSAGDWIYNLNGSSPSVQALELGCTLKDFIPIHTFDGTEGHVIIRIDGVEQAPTITGNNVVDSVVSSVLNQPPSVYTIANLTFSDPDFANPAVYSLQTSLSGPDAALFSLDSNNNLLFNAPVYVVNGTNKYTVDVNASDGFKSSTEEFTVTVNDIPPVANDSSLNALELTQFEAFVGESSYLVVSGQVSADDPLGLPLTYSIVSNPTNGTVLSFDPVTGKFTYLPNPDFYGVDSFQFQASDGSSSGTGTVTINVVANSPAIFFNVIHDADFNLGTVSLNDIYVSKEFNVSDPDPGQGIFFNSSGAFVTPYGTYGYFVLGNFISWAYQLDSNSQALRALHLNQSHTDIIPIYSFDGTEEDILVTIQGVEQAPTISVNGVVISSVDSSLPNQAATTYTIASLSFNDPEVTAFPAIYALQESLSGPDANLFYLDPSGNLIFAAPVYVIGGTNQYSVDVNVTDGYQSVTQSFTVTVNDIAPTASPGSVTAVQFNQFESDHGEANALAIQGQVSGSSVLLFTVTYSLLSDVSHGSLIFNLDGTFSYTPTLGYYGPDSFQFQVSDGVLTSSSSENITVNQNSPAVISGVNFGSVNEGQPSVSGQLIISDPDPGQNSFLAVTLKGTYGQLVLDSFGNWQYTLDQADPNVKALKTNDNPLNDNFSVYSFDGTTSPVSITISGIEQAPTITVNGSPVTIVNSALVSETIASLSFSDSDVVSAPSIYSLSSSLTGTDASLFSLDNQNNLIFNNPGYNVGGNNLYSVTVNVSDGYQTTSKNFTVTVSNLAPIANTDIYYVDENVRLDVDNIFLPGVLANDTSPSGNPLTAHLEVGGYPTYSQFFSLALNGSFTYLPAYDFYGTDSFSYYVSDGTVSSIPAIVYIVVNHVNQSPVAVPDTYSMDENGDTPTSLVVSASNGVLANDSDPDNDPMTAILDSGPYYGTLKFNSDGSFTYVPNKYFHGQDVFYYYATDGLLNSQVVPVHINVAHVNQAPVANPDFYSVDELTTLTVSAANGVLANDTDPDNDKLTAVLDTGTTNGSLTLNSDGSFSYTPYGFYYGPDSFTYHAFDGQLSSTPVKVSIGVIHVPQVPYAIGDFYALNEDQSLTVAAPGVLYNDYNPDNLKLTAHLYSTSSIYGYGSINGSLTLNSDGSFTYIPNKGFTGDAYFSYYLTGSTYISSAVDVLLVVNPVTVASVIAEQNGVPGTQSLPLITNPAGSYVGDGAFIADLNHLFGTTGHTYIFYNPQSYPAANQFTVQDNLLMMNVGSGLQHPGGDAIDVTVFDETGNTFQEVYVVENQSPTIDTILTGANLSASNATIIENKGSGSFAATVTGGNDTVYESAGVNGANGANASSSGTPNPGGSGSQGFSSSFTFTGNDCILYGNNGGAGGNGGSGRNIPNPTAGGSGGNAGAFSILYTGDSGIIYGGDGGIGGKGGDGGNGAAPTKSGDGGSGGAGGTYTITYDGNSGIIYGGDGGKGGAGGNGGTANPKGAAGAGGNGGDYHIILNGDNSTIYGGNGSDGGVKGTGAGNAKDGSDGIYQIDVTGNNDVIYLGSPGLGNGLNAGSYLFNGNFGVTNASLAGSSSIHLGSNTTIGHNMVIDGGSLGGISLGKNSLVLDNVYANLDLSGLAGANLKNLEILDMGQQSSASAVTISNTFVDGINSFHVFSVKGNANDTLHIGTKLTLDNAPADQLSGYVTYHDTTGGILHVQNAVNVAA